ncbi:hypothetical protein C8R48DRAFT_49038 [Suillus tomentosus]|nr:hypothetical protein C8R48DRAFT_49038 [Suillus tomentosus]
MADASTFLLLPVSLVPATRRPWTVKTWSTWRVVADITEISESDKLSAPRTVHYNQAFLKHPLNSITHFYISLAVTVNHDWTAPPGSSGTWLAPQLGGRMMIQVMRRASQLITIKVVVYSLSDSASILQALLRYGHSLR